MLVVALMGCGSSSSGGDVDAGTNTTGDASVPDGDSSFVFDPDAIRTFELTLPDADWQWLNDNAQDEIYVEASLQYEGRTYSKVGLRYKGGFGTLYSCFDGAGNRICPKLSMKIKFNEYVADQRFYGLKRLNFHSMKSDDSKMRDFFAYSLFRDNGVHAPRSTYAKLVVNGELLGLFALIEQIDGRFSRMNFPDGGEGNVYKEVWPQFTTPEPYISALKTNEDENPSADKMVRFAQALAAADDSTFVSVLQSWTDLDMLMRFLAVDRLIDNWDGIVGWYCQGATCFNHNFYWYESTTEDRLWLIPWDMDNTFDEPSPIRTYYSMPDWDESTSCAPIQVFWGINGRAPGCDPLIQRLARVTWDRYVAATQAVLADSFALDTLNARVDALAAHLESSIAEDPNLDISMQDWRDAVLQLKSSMAAKRAYIENKIAE